MNRLRRLRTTSSNSSTSVGSRKSKTLSSSSENILAQKDGVHSSACKFHNASLTSQAGDATADCEIENGLQKGSSTEDVPCTCQELNTKSIRTRSLKWTKGKFSASGIYKRLNKGYSVDSLTLTDQNEAGANKPVVKSNSGSALWSNYGKKGKNRSKDNLTARSDCEGDTSGDTASAAAAGLDRAFGNCIIQESNEETSAHSYNASANATLERDPSSMSQQSQLPPPMPDLSPSSSFGLPRTTSPTGSSAMKNHRTASPNSQPTILSLEDLMSKFEMKQPTTKRECMVFEIADTEAKYVVSLAQVVEGYMAVTMGSSSSGGSTQANDFSNASTGNVNGGCMASGSSNSISIPTDLADRLHIVWGNIRQIYEWHRNTLFPNLGAACYSNNLLDVANCFIRHERRFLMYSKYSINLPKADYILGEFDNFFSDVRKSLNLKMGLKDLLVEPVQRAMRYQLMVQGVVAHLDKHPEDLMEEEKGHMDRLRLCLNVMTKIPKEVNDMMQLGKLLDYDGKIYGSITAQGKLLLQASVRFHAEGSPNLNNSSNKKKDGKKSNISPTTSSTSAPIFSNYGGLEFTEQDSRQVFLFEQSMLVAEAEKSCAPSTFIGPRYFFKNFIKGSSMNGVLVEGSNGSSKSSNGRGDHQPTALQFRLECADRNYEFLFENPQTCHLWATTITNLIMDRRDFAKALSKPIEFQKKQLLISSHGSNATMTNSTTSSSTSSNMNSTAVVAASAAVAQTSEVPSANIAMT